MHYGNETHHALKELRSLCIAAIRSSHIWAAMNVLSKACFIKRKLRNILGNTMLWSGLRCITFYQVSQGINWLTNLLMSPIFDTRQPLSWQRLELAKVRSDVVTT